MAGQNHISCKKHQVPMIWLSKRDRKCTRIYNATMIYIKKEMIRCSELICQVRI